MVHRGTDRESLTRDKSEALLHHAWEEAMETLDFDASVIELSQQLEKVVAYTESCRRRAPELDAEALELIHHAVDLYRRTLDHAVR